MKSSSGGRRLNEGINQLFNKIIRGYEINKEELLQRNRIYFRFGQLNRFIIDNI